MKDQKRPKVTLLCLLYWEDRILVYEGYDKDKNQTFYRCLGGSLEYGEALEDSLRREMMEELGEGITDIYPIGVANSVFTWNGKRTHRLFMVYDARLRNASRYTTEPFTLEEGGETLTVQWKPLDDFKNGDTLHPYGLLEMIEKLKKGEKKHWIIK